jgi:acyl dehydratase
MWNKGHRFPLEKRGPIQREDLVRYADASGDRNRIHLEEDFAKEAGFPSVIVHGMLSMSFLGDYLIQFFPESQYKLTLFRARFKHVTFPGDVLNCEAEVRDLPDEEPDKKPADNKKVQPEVAVHVWATNDKGELITDGECRFAPVGDPEKTAL